MGADRRARAHRRHRRGPARPRPPLPDGRAVPRRSRRRTRPLDRSPGRAARDLHVATRRARLSARTAPLAGAVPVSGERRAQPAERASRSGRLRRACAADDRPAAVPDPRVGEVRRRDQLRAADAHRPEPLVAAREERTTVVAPRDVPLPLRRRRRQRADAPRTPRPASGDRDDDRAARDARSATPSSTRRSCPRPAFGGRSSRTAPTCSTAASTSPRPTARGSSSALAFKPTGVDWIGYTSYQSKSTSLDWVKFAEHCTPRELELFGFPPPGHPIWDTALARRDRRSAIRPSTSTPWRDAL